MSKISNALLMLKILESGRIFKIKELSELLECSERTVRTYKEDLEKSGIYIESIPGRYGGYYYTCSNNSNYFGIDKNDLNLLENIYLYLVDTEYYDTESYNKIIDKIRYQIINNFNNKNDNNNKLLSSNYSILSNAIVNNSNIEFVYKKSICLFEPHNIYIYSGNYFVTGINKKINQIRTYNILDIKNLKIL